MVFLNSKVPNICKTNYNWYNVLHSKYSKYPLIVFFVPKFNFEEKNLIVRSKQIWKFVIYNMLLAIRFCSLEGSIFFFIRPLLWGTIIFHKNAKENVFDDSLAAFENLRRADNHNFSKPHK